MPIFVSRHVFRNAVNGTLTIEGPIETGMIRIGHKCIGIFDHKRSRAIWEVNGAVVFKGNAFIGHGSKISVGRHGRIIFGNNFSVTSESAIVAAEKTITFGTGCLLSRDILIMDNDGHNIYNAEKEIVNAARDIAIGNQVWIGCRCLILKGADIPDHAIIAANSLVSKKLVGDHSIFGGQPISELKKNVSWEN